mmetsp:Transcript_49029/g.147670  ORF Transcript_49029/g.147670 Transcript_49029/m.147670 type:complete len:462 (-) Transcript_49029:343-1728(-)
MVGLTSIPLALILAGLVSGFSPMPPKTHQQPTTSALRSIPSLIVFDLDNTVWTPELYQLRKLQRQKDALPVAGKDVELFPGAQRVIESIQSSPEKWGNTQFAVASRTKSASWAKDLLDQFDLADFFHHVEIFPGDKKTHFENLREKSGVPYEEMLFFDDSRDGRYGNCVPVSKMGVLSVHCPGGIHEEEIFHNGMKRFAEWGKEPNTVVEWDGSVTVLPENERFQGVVKKVVTDRGFGFIRYGGRKTKDLFFHFNDLPANQEVNEGDSISFVVTNEKRNGKQKAEDITIESLSQGKQDSADTVNMRVFSMNLPFAALLANEYKTLETRNGTMFVPYEEGTKMLLHVGRRTYPDGDRHIDVMQSGGLSDAEISKLKSLPKGFGRGMAVAIVELGKTYETTLEERCDTNFQRSVGAFGADSGKMVTEIKRVEYLKSPTRVSGRGGVFKADVDRSAIPEGWLEE